ncbi:host-nuclease inhibitor Gam family protein [Paralysiella testudinis]|uniref:Host-nuclease inhibitor Gam family protein n=1 Tax=Paralysiella testudinis TaxID=2809020 RepID=A0A892ZI73_9NEIS|nr:host-nuclease inhibitor Gam family protein [Paralysiella testudinis]QRQ82343.1 host-nuclease inhibitor Gam family protein [Paralysiella testudinis]
MSPIIYTSAEAFQAAFSLLAKLEQQRASKAAKLQAKINALQAKHNEDTSDLCEEIDTIRTALYAYAHEHRAELTDNGKSKTVAMGSGSIKWRKQPAKVEISGDVAAVLAALKRRRLGRFIRVKEELDKAALLKDPAAIKTPIQGLQIVQGVETLSIDTGVK